MADTEKYYDQLLLELESLRSQVGPLSPSHKEASYA